MPAQKHRIGKAHMCSSNAEDAFMAAAACVNPPPRGAEGFLMAVDPLPPAAFKFAVAEAERTDFVEDVVAWLLVSRQDCFDAEVAFALIAVVARAPRGAMCRTVGNPIRSRVFNQSQRSQVCPRLQGGCDGARGSYDLFTSATG